MDKETRIQFIETLTNKINEYVEEDNLFCGGCCYAAYVLAEALKAAGIRYNTVMFQYNEILNVNNFNDAINGKGVSHVAIEVRLRNKRHFIGTCKDIYDFFRCTQFKYNVCRYKGITPAELLDGYKHGNWNSMYRTNMNKILAMEVRHITREFTGKEIFLDYADLQAGEPTWIKFDTDIKFANIGPFRVFL